MCKYRAAISSVYNHPSNNSNCAFPGPQIRLLVQLLENVKSLILTGSRLRAGVDSFTLFLNFTFCAESLVCGIISRELFVGARATLPLGNRASAASRFLLPKSISLVASADP